ncbi:BZ3500_MvSof-1268-A1-R1_Chr5-3g08221 [Microbotryum saponariae]|uniref:BZ3500_MvSof-1268-A1-R1_Chr5-3g08221 protein n=1 Tax=Microbotryum saponariae TaxID=289078 RepID=A0A2X0LQZ9_9BASI|nr:BZ3500_MvSof-1268-A1-R1_Chr5-3g08221 [Microbotryum saponariae]SDA07980.1 BZ3501_MvSof-1269-A2-R1_Chr5-1g07365 [Microbotryum saponariae]
MTRRLGGLKASNDVVNGKGSSESVPVRSHTVLRRTLPLPHQHRRISLLPEDLGHNDCGDSGKGSKMILSINHLHPSQRPTSTLSRSDDLTVWNLRERVRFAHGDIHPPHSHRLHCVHCRRINIIQWIHRLFPPDPALPNQHRRISPPPGDLGKMIALANHLHPSQRPMSTLSRSDDLTVRNLRERVQFAHSDIHPPQSPIALRPLPEGAYPRHDLGAMDVLFRKCCAFHWDFERLGGRDTPVFRACCDDGKVELPIKKPPNTLLEFLTGHGQGMLGIMPLFLGAVHLTKTRCIVCTVEKLFRERILAFNENLAMASFGTSQDYGIIGADGRPSFYLSGNVYHRMGTLAPARGSNPVFAQILFGAPSERIDARIRFNGPLSDDEQQLAIAYRQILPRLDEMMLQENRRAQQSLTAREFINHEDAHAYQLRLLAPRNRDPRRYNLPTQDSELLGSRFRGARRRN